MLVVAARLKGAGMRRAREQVDPTVARRTAVCSDRWEEAWPQIVRQLRAQARQQTRARRAARLAPPPAVAMPPRPAPAAGTPPGPDEPDGRWAAPGAPVAGRPKPVVDGRPTAAHPWKRTYRASHVPTATATEL